MRLNPNQEYGPNKIQITVVTPVDTTRLYGPWDDAIAYLQELKEICPTGSLAEEWTGYEDMEMSYSFVREENDEEFARRQENEKWLRQRARADKSRNEQREKDLKQFNALKSKLGM